MTLSECAGEHPGSIEWPRVAEGLWLKLWPRGCPVAECGVSLWHEPGREAERGFGDGAVWTEAPL